MLPWHIETSINLLAFFQIGCILRPIFFQIYKWIDSNKKLGNWGIATTLIVIGGAIASLNERVDIRLDSYGNTFAYYIAALCSIFGWLLIAMLIGNNSTLEVLGKESLALMVMHKFPILVFQEIIPVIKQYLSEPNTLIGGVCILITSIITLLLCHIATAVIDMICPTIIGNRRKN